MMYFTTTEARGRILTNMNALNSARNSAPSLLTTPPPAREVTEEILRRATTAVKDEAGSTLCTWIDMQTKRVCRVNIGQNCLCQQVARAALEAALLNRT